MTWIKTIGYDESKGALRQLYDRVRGANGQIDNILSVHSLRPHTLKGHMTLYKNVLHHRNNILPQWFLEVLGVYTSYLNRCEYCVLHHLAGLRVLLDDEKRFEQIRDALNQDQFESTFNKPYNVCLTYAHKLTTVPDKVTVSDYHKLKENGMSDGEILEVNQVVSYFAYVNRTALGLGVETAGETLGMSPSKGLEDHWEHV